MKKHEELEPILKDKIIKMIRYGFRHTLIFIKYLKYHIKAS